jgi:hypothetical protein
MFDEFVNELSHAIGHVNQVMMKHGFKPIRAIEVATFSDAETLKYGVLSNAPWVRQVKPLLPDGVAGVCCDVLVKYPLAEFAEQKNVTAGAKSWTDYFLSQRPFTDEVENNLLKYALMRVQETMFWLEADPAARKVIEAEVVFAIGKTNG